MGWKGNIAWAFGTVLCLASVLFIASIPYQLCLGGGAVDEHVAGRSAVEAICAPNRPGWGTALAMLAVIGASLLGWRMLRKDVQKPFEPQP
ncbi:MAG: hypothetical protein QM765_24030 [Myxococcales bacterium]